MTLTLLSILLYVKVTQNLPLPLTKDHSFNVFPLFSYPKYSNSNGISFPKDWPFSDETLNYVTIILGTIVLILVIMFCCCVCFHICFRTHYEEVLVVTPSELIAIGAKPSDLRVANITTSDLKESGASSRQIKKLGFPGSTQESSETERSSVKTRNDIKLNKGLTSPTSPTSPTSSLISKQTEIRGENNESNISNASTICAKRSSLMSENVKLMAEKLKDKPNSRSVIEKKTGKAKSLTTETSPKKESQKANKDNVPTVSKSSAKKAAALKKVDDSFSTSMGPTEKS